MRIPYRGGFSRAGPEVEREGEEKKVGRIESSCDD